MAYTKGELVHLVKKYTLEIAKAKHEKRQRENAFISDPRCLNGPSDHSSDFNPEKVRTTKSYEKANLANMRNTLSQKKKKLRDLKLIIAKQKAVCQFLYDENHSMVDEIWNCKTEEEIEDKIELFYACDTCSTSVFY
jgi:hypothetical protein